jgi:prevent-host-death family protein
MTRTIISPSDLSQRTREILDRVQEGELAVVASGGEERIVLLDALDYRLLRALAVCATGEDVNGGLLEARVLRDYLAEKINLGKAAELLQLSRFELEESFQRLGVPLRRGARSLKDAQAEIAAARLHA